MLFTVINPWHAEYFYVLHRPLPTLYPGKMQYSSNKYIFTNSVNPDQVNSSETSWSGSTLFSKKDKSTFSRKRVNSFFASVDLSSGKLFDTEYSWNNFLKKKTILKKSRQQQ